eukprot:gene6807-6498_t
MVRGCSAASPPRAATETEPPTSACFDGAAAGGAGPRPVEARLRDLIGPEAAVRASAAVGMFPDAPVPSSLASELCSMYSDLDPEGRADFLDHIACEFAVDPLRADDSCAVVREAVTAGEPQTLQAAVARAQRDLTPFYEYWLHQAVCLPGGLLFMINLRSDLLAIQAAATQPGSPAVMPESSDMLCDI